MDMIVCISLNSRYLSIDKIEFLTPVYKHTYLLYESTSIRVILYKDN